MVAKKNSAKSLSEWDAIAALQRALSRAPLPPEICVAIGDDAAVLRCHQPLVWSIDSSSEGAHFDLRWIGLGLAAARAVTAAVSDLAAMAAEPLGALCHVQLPKGTSEQQVAEIAKYQLAITKQLKCPIIGGNVTRGHEFQFTTTVLGKAPEPLLRSEARAGDELWLIGEVGEAGAGLQLLSRTMGKNQRHRYWAELLNSGADQNALSRAARRCVRRWRCPRALIAQGLSLRGAANAALDVSDGIASDAQHLATASDVAVVLDHTAMRRAASSALRLCAEAMKLEALDLVLYGGEDYALLATGPAEHRPENARVIGHVETGAGLWWNDGSRVRAGGFDHLKDA